MTTLITGGTGFIGAEVARLLLAKGEQKPVVFDINPARQRLDDVAEQTEVVRGDLSNFSHVLDVVKAVRPTVIYHLGGMLSVPSEADPAAAFMPIRWVPSMSWRLPGSLGYHRCFFPVPSRPTGEISRRMWSRTTPSSGPSCFTGLPRCSVSCWGSFTSASKAWIFEGCVIRPWWGQGSKRPA
jgi:hypothetical protein